jgi:transcriptional regulator with XRE-family HTH domain
MDFNTKLRLLRTARGMTQKDLAEKTGIPDTYISNMETGKLVPAGSWMDAIKNALDWPGNDDVFTLLSAKNGQAQPEPQEQPA